MMYYKPTPLFSSKFLYRYRMLMYGNSYINSVRIISPPPVQSYCKGDHPWAYNTYIRYVLADVLSLTLLFIGCTCSLPYRTKTFGSP